MTKGKLVKNETTRQR
jgi:hypothetical protein